MKKFSSFWVLLLLLSFSLTANAQDYLRGDVNGDGKVSIPDVSMLVDLLLENNGSTNANADVNLDGQVAISDVTVLIDYLLTGSWGDEPVTPDDESVDLGLPSGTLWATHNVGATNPEDCGDSFAWGETVPNKEY